MIETLNSLQSSGLNFGTPLDLVQSLVVPITPRLMVKRRGNTERWSRPWNVYYLSNPYLKLSCATCCVMLSLQSTQQLLRVLGSHYFILFMGNRLGYLLMLLLGIRVEGLLLLILFIICRSLSRRLRIISSEPKSIRSTTLTSTIIYRSIRWENKYCSLRRHFTWLALVSLGLGLLDILGYWSVWGRLPTDWISGGDLKMCTMSSTSPRFASTPLEAHLQTHSSQSKLKVKNTLK